MRKTVALLALLALGGCVAENVERRRPRKGPIKEVGFVDLGGGSVRYSTEGWSWFVAGRRRHAMRLMRKNCGKELVPRITDEYRRQDADISYAGEDIATNLDKGMDHFKIAPFDHLVYECRTPATANDPIRASTAPTRAILVVPPVAEISTAAVTAPVVSTAAAQAPAVSTTTVPQEPPK